MYVAINMYNAYMPVCMHACSYVCMYACIFMYACTYVSGMKPGQVSGSHLLQVNSRK